MHALSSRITSLYWFNLSLKSLLRFPDTWEPVARIGREIKMLEPIILEGDVYEYLQTTDGGSPNWDLASIASPDAVLLFANDLRYVADEQESVFKFGPARDVEFSFRLPPWLRSPSELKRLDVDGLHDVVWNLAQDRVTISDQRTLAAIYVAVNDPAVLDAILARRDKAIEHELNNAISLEEVQEQATE